MGEHNENDADRGSPHRAAVALTEGLHFILHRIGLIGGDVTGPAVREASALHFDGGVRAWRLIEPFAFIVPDGARKQAVLPPDSHGGGRYLRAARDLVQGQHPSLATTKRHEVRCGSSTAYTTSRTNRAHDVTEVNGAIIITSTGRSPLTVNCTRSVECGVTIGH
jgi:hypothetical protein